MDLFPNRYDLGKLRFKETSPDHYRVVIKHFKVGFCQLVYEYSHAGGPGID